MPFCYGIVPTVATFLSTSGTANSEMPNLVIRQGGTTAGRNVDVTMITVGGRANAATSISGIEWRVRRWTTSGSGGTAVTPQPRRIGTTASTSAASSETTITAGSVSGAYVLVLNCGAGGPGYWMARNQDAVLTLEGDGRDEFDINSITTPTSLPVTCGAEIEE